MSTSKKEYNFVLILAGLTKPDSHIEDALFKAGCNDAVLAFRNRVGYLEFDREATEIVEAIVTAVTDVERANIGAQVIRVEPGDLVNASEIARRSGLTREYIRLLSQGKRGEGDFPIPQSGITGKTLIWSWAEVVQWLYEKRSITNKSSLHKAITIRDLNVALEYLHSPKTMKRRRELLNEFKKRERKVSTKGKPHKTAQVAT